MGAAIAKLCSRPRSIVARALAKISSRPRPIVARAIGKLCTALVPLRAGFLVWSMTYGLVVLTASNHMGYWEFAYFFSTLGSALDLLFIFLPKLKLTAIVSPTYGVVVMFNLLCTLDFLISGYQTGLWRLAGMLTVWGCLWDILSILRNLKEAMDGQLLPR